MKYTLTGEEYKQIRDAVGCGVQDVQRTLVALNLRHEVREAKTIDALKPAILACLSLSINPKVLEEILDKNQ